MRFLKLILAAAVLCTGLPLAAQNLDAAFTGVFKGDDSQGIVVSWKLNLDGTMRGQWTTNRDSVSIEVSGKYQRDEQKIVFLVDGSVKLASGEVVKLKLTGSGDMTQQGGSGTYTQFSEDSRLGNDSGTWDVVSSFTTLTLQKPVVRRVIDTQTSEQNREQKAAVQEIRNAFLPGVSASYIVPFEGSAYIGGNIHYAFIQGISSSTSSYNFGGYYEWYSEIGYYKQRTSGLNDDIFFTYASGVNLSFEKFLNSYRAVFVPYFGAKVGGIYFNKAPGGLFIEPTVGLVIIQTKSLNINYDAGLFLNTTNLSDFIGLHHSVILNFNL